MTRRNEKGFTLVEVIVVAAIIAILAGILVPMIFSQIDEAKISRAKADMRSISSSIYAFRKDVGRWPRNSADAACDSNLLASDAGISADVGVALTGLLYNTRNVKTFSSQLMSDPGNGCYNNWNGPYLGSVELDPWGNPYIVNSINFDTDGAAALIISAGPDGVFNTQADADAVDANDLGLRLK